MKKALIAFTFLACSFTVPLNAQDGIITSLSDEQIETLKKDAEKWFKDVYVEEFFKDPYSYRLVGLKALPVTVKEGFTKQYLEVCQEIDKSTVAKSERNQESLDKLNELYEDCMQNIEKENKNISDGINVEYSQKRLAIYKKYAVEAAEAAKSIALYLLYVEERDRLQNLINGLTEESAISLLFYDIRLDCYSKNSMGNEVLGRYSFPFTINGPLGDQNGIDKVVQLNK